MSSSKRRAYERLRLLPPQLAGSGEADLPEADPAPVTVGAPSLFDG
jgi:hypothetical protein